VRRRTLGRREEVEKERVLGRREEVVRVRHKQAKLGERLRSLYKLESRGSTAACQRVLVSVENQSPLCILVFLTPWISSTLGRLCPGVPGWWDIW